MWWSCCVLYFLFLINFILWAECCGAVGISKMFYQVNSISRFYVGHQPPLYKASQSSDPLRCFLCFCDDFKTENRSNHLADFTNQDNTDETKLSSLPSMLISPGAISVSTTKWRKRKKIKESMRPFHSTEQIPEKKSVCSLDF